MKILRASSLGSNFTGSYKKRNVSVHKRTQSSKGLCLTNASELQLIKKKLTSRRTTVSVVKQPSPNITRFFALHCPMSGANIQACFEIT